MRTSILFFASTTLAGLCRSQLTPSPTFNPAPSSSATVASSSSSVPNPQWANLLGDVIWFYDAQRSGRLGTAGGATYQNRVDWRNTSQVTLKDGSDSGVDLSGGFFDAGDYLLLAFPLYFTLSNIAWGGINFGRGYELAGQSAYLDSNLRWGFDWLIKTHPSANTLYVQVGTDDVDNNYWGGDQNIPTPRTSFQINATSPGTDAAAGAAAAFAAGAVLYQGQGSLINSSWTSTRLANATYASTLLNHATDLYKLARNTTQQVYQDSVPAAAAVYASNGYKDDLVYAALWLYLATNQTAFLDEAQSMYSDAKFQGSNAVLNWDSKVPALPLLFMQIKAARSVSLPSTYQTEMERYFDRIVNNQKAKDVQSSMTNGGLLYYQGDSNEASLNPALNCAMMMYQYAPLASSSDKRQSYLNFADGQVDYALGKNPMNIPYVVGLHPNSPINPHSAQASGGNDITQIDSVPPTEAYVLYGAVIGGPDYQDRMFDIRSDYPETEIALDYNAPMLAISAYHVATDVNDPFYVQIAAGTKVTPSGRPTDAAFPGGRSGSGNSLSQGAKIAIGVVVTVVGLVIVGLVWRWLHLARKYKR